MVARVPTRRRRSQYNGYTIVASPRQDGGVWRVMGSIRKEIDGEVRTHEFIRADTQRGSGRAR